MLLGFGSQSILIYFISSSVSISLMFLYWFCVFVNFVLKGHALCQLCSNTLHILHRIDRMFALELVSQASWIKRTSKPIRRGKPEIRHRQNQRICVYLYVETPPLYWIFVSQIQIYIQLYFFKFLSDSDVFRIHCKIKYLHSNK